ncbi:hypothetical protein HKQ42_10480 [Neisseria meningitidis]|nr:hypothetical protein [Neisseria meningitidis]MBJ7752051.1 hypothetical protein [Neisseria meningitidis]
MFADFSDVECKAIQARIDDYSGLTKIRTRRRSRRQYKQYGTDSLGASAP